MARQPADKSTKNDDSALIRELALLLDETSLTEIEIERSGLRVRVARNISVAASLPTAHAPRGVLRPPALLAAAGGRPRACRVGNPGTLGCRSGQASRRGPLADGGPRLLGAGARRQAVCRGRHQGLGRPDAAHHRSDED